MVHDRQREKRRACDASFKTVCWLQLAWQAAHAVFLVRLENMMLAEAHVLYCWSARFCVLNARQLTRREAGVRITAVRSLAHG